MAETRDAEADLAVCIKAESASIRRAELTASQGQGVGTLMPVEDLGRCLNRAEFDRSILAYEALPYWIAETQSLQRRIEQLEAGLTRIAGLEVVVESHADCANIAIHGINIARKALSPKEQPEK
jgi:hypothetical protein